MSYCRWSSDNFKCDIYCFEHCDGYFAVWVAGSRYAIQEPLPPPIEFLIESVPLVKIGLPHDGEQFEEPDAASAADRLEALRAVGYNVPQYAIDELREEAAAPKAST